jgi:hypothetical protein
VGVGRRLALTGTCRHQVTAISYIQSLILIFVWQHLALAGIGKQLVPFSNGIDHGIAAPGFCAVHQYHAMLVELFMVSAISLD